MKKTFTFLSVAFVLVSAQSFSQGIVVLPSYGIQKTISNVHGSSPVLSSSRQTGTGRIATIRALIDNNKGHGLFVGIADVNQSLSVKTYPDLNSEGRMSSVAGHKRLEIGYHLISKPIYLNNLLDNDKQGKSSSGLYFRVQPMIGLGYNLGTYNPSGGGHISGGNTSLENIIHHNRNFSLLAGGNLYIGSNKKTWFFISVMKNWNVGNNTSSATLNTQYNGSQYQQKLTSAGSGSSYSIGIPIGIPLKSAKKKRDR